MSEAQLKSVTTKTKDGKEVRISVRQISNGWIIQTNTEYKDAKGNWQYDSKEEYSEENPLDPKMLKIDIIKEALGKK
jgi:major membrane immunogen (membrane-anchored lipoprotein)